MSVDAEQDSKSTRDPLTVERVQALLRSLEGRLPLHLELNAAVGDVRRMVGEVTLNVPQADAASFAAAVTKLDEVTRPVAQALAWTTAWGEKGMHDRVMRSAVQRLANIVGPHDHSQTWPMLRRWPAVLALAAIGTAAVDAEREDAIGHVLSRVVVYGTHRDEPAAVALTPTAAIDYEAARHWLGATQSQLPVDDLLYERIVEWLVPDLIDSTAQVQHSFDRFQFLAGLIYMDQKSNGQGGGWAPAGTFSWRRPAEWSVPEAISKEILLQGMDWPLLSAGLFGSSPSRATQILESYQSMIKQRHY